MSRDQGTFNFAANLEPTVKAPLDARMLVDTLADLTSSAQWTQADGNNWLYDGAMVLVKSDTSDNNGLYYLSSSANFDTASNWLRVGSSDNIYVSQSGQNVILGFISSSNIQIQGSDIDSFDEDTFPRVKFVDINNPSRNASIQFNGQVIQITGNSPNYIGNGALEVNSLYNVGFISNVMTNVVGYGNDINLSAGTLLRGSDDTTESEATLNWKQQKLFSNLEPFPTESLISLDWHDRELYQLNTSRSLSWQSQSLYGNWMVEETSSNDNSIVNYKQLKDFVYISQSAQSVLFDNVIISGNSTISGSSGSVSITSNEVSVNGYNLSASLSSINTDDIRNISNVSGSLVTTALNTLSSSLYSTIEELSGSFDDITTNIIVNSSSVSGSTLSDALNYLSSSISVGGSSLANIEDIANGVQISGSGLGTVGITHDGTQGVISSSTNNLDIYTGGVHNITIKNGQIIQCSTGGTLYLYGNGGASPGGQMSLNTNGFSLLAGGSGLVCNSLHDYVRVDNADFYLHTEGKRIYNSVGDLNLTGASTDHYVNIGQYQGQGVAGLRVYENSNTAADFVELYHTGSAGVLRIWNSAPSITLSDNGGIVLQSTVSAASQVTFNSVGIQPAGGDIPALNLGVDAWSAWNDLYLAGTSYLYNVTDGGGPNFERLTTKWDTNVAIIATEAGGTGTQRNLTINSNLTTIENAVVKSGDNLSIETGSTDILELSDSGLFKQYTNSVSVTVTVPTNASVPFPVGTLIEGIQDGTGQVTINGDVGVTINSAGGANKTTLRYSAFSLKKSATDTWYLIGDLTT